MIEVVYKFSQYSVLRFTNQQASNQQARGAIIFLLDNIDIDNVLALQWRLKNNTLYTDINNETVSLQQYITCFNNNTRFHLIGSNRISIHFINTNRMDFRRTNLRVGPNSNRRNSNNNRGYVYNRTTNRYNARIVVNGHCIHLGSYLTSEEAHNRYIVAREEYRRMQSAILELLNFH